MDKPISKKMHYHSTVSRRDFMKMLGIGAGAVGLGVAGCSESSKDLDEMMDSPLDEGKEMNVTNKFRVSPEQREALANAEIIIKEWIETAEELGRPIPIPKGKLMYA